MSCSKRLSSSGALGSTHLSSGDAIEMTFGQGVVATAGSTDVSLDAPVSSSLVLLAVGLALLGGLIAGAVGGLRASRLRPADALRHLD